MAVNTSPLFVPSDDEQFEPQVHEGGGDNIDFATQDTDAWRQGVRGAFDDYQTRSDIEGRRSILARENAQPGSIFWNVQTDPTEVDVITTDDANETVGLDGQASGTPA